MGGNVDFRPAQGNTLDVLHISVTCGVPIQSRGAAPDSHGREPVGRYGINEFEPRQGRLSELTGSSSPQGLCRDLILMAIGPLASRGEKEPVNDRFVARGDRTAETMERQGFIGVRLRRRDCVAKATNATIFRATTCKVR